MSSPSSSRWSTGAVTLALLALLAGATLQGCGGGGGGAAAPRCGDGHLDAGEECDDGNLVNDDGCTNTCKLPVCGDGIVQAGEQCDDGNAVNNDGCTNTCRLPACGDGIVQAGEQCDGADLAGQSCPSLGFTGGTLACGPACTFVTAACTP